MQHFCKAQEWESEIIETFTAQREGKVLEQQFFSNDATTGLGLAG